MSPEPRKIVHIHRYVCRCCMIANTSEDWLKKNLVANAFISPFNTQTMHIKSFYTQQHCYVSLKTLCPGGVWTRVFSFLRRIICPLRHAARVRRLTLLHRYVRAYVHTNFICPVPLFLFFNTQTNEYEVNYAHKQCIVCELCTTALLWFP
jgi:hypothetical protein